MNFVQDLTQTTTVYNAANATTSTMENVNKLTLSVKNIVNKQEPVPLATEDLLYPI